MQFNSLFYHLFHCKYLQTSLTILQKYHFKLLHYFTSWIHQNLPDSFPIVVFGLFTSFYYFANKMNNCIHKFLYASLTISLKKIQRSGISRSIDLNSLKVHDPYCQIALRQWYHFTMHEWSHVTVLWPSLSIISLESLRSPLYFSQCPSTWVIFLTQPKLYDQI